MLGPGDVRLPFLGIAICLFSRASTGLWAAEQAAAGEGGCISDRKGEDDEDEDDQGEGGGEGGGASAGKGADDLDAVVRLIAGGAQP